MTRTDQLKNELNEVLYFYNKSKDYIHQDINVVFFQKLTTYLIKKQLILSDEINEIDMKKENIIKDIKEITKNIVEEISND